jgi:hypothetical protein
MDRVRDGRCPAKMYDDPESASRVLLGLFESQEDCARFHGCPERRCAIEGRWPRQGRPDRRVRHPMTARFVGVAFDGPKPPDETSGGRSGS